jgi:hypothetical protein
LSVLIKLLLLGIKKVFQRLKFPKILQGMKREAVQEERHKFKHKSEGRSFSPSSFYELKEELKDSESYNELDDDLVLVAEEKSFLERITKAEDSFNPEKADQAPNVSESTYFSLLNEYSLNRRFLNF